MTYDQYIAQLQQTEETPLPSKEWGERNQDVLDEGGYQDGYNN